MDPQKEVMELLKQHGVPERHGKHQTYRVYGRLIAITGTKTDRRGWLNKRAEVRRALQGAVN